MSELSASAPANNRPDAGNLLERLERACSNPSSLTAVEKEALQADAQHFFEGSPVKRSIEELNEAWFNDIRERSLARAEASKTGTSEQGPTEAAPED